MNIMDGFIFHDIIECITSALDAKNPYSGKHSRRVGDMTELICKKLGLSDEETSQIHIAGHIHDIGEIGLPDSILLKDSKLNDYEWNLVKQHPKIGAELLSKSEKLSGIAAIVSHHHERFDGCGYPFGAKGEEIPLGARIIAVCDSIDAMASERAYRSALPMEEVRMEIHNNIGTMYDPNIAVIALKEWDKIIEMYE